MEEAHVETAKGGERMIRNDLSDFIVALQDCLDDMRETLDYVRKSELHLSAGSCILHMHEQLDQIDCEYALQICELKPEKAEQYKQAYLAFVRRQLEAKS